MLHTLRFRCDRKLIYNDHLLSLLLCDARHSHITFGSLSCGDLFGGDIIDACLDDTPYSSNLSIMLVYDMS